MATEAPLGRKHGSNGNGNGNGNGHGHKGNGDELSVNEQIREILHVIFKRWRLVAVLFLLVALPGLMLSVVRKPAFIATGKVLITSQRADLSLQPTDTDRFSTVTLNEAAVNSEVHIIRSRELLERVAQRVASGNGNGARNGRGANGKAAAANDELAGDEKLGLQAMKLAENLMVTPIKNSNVIQIDYRSSDPKRAAFTVNRVLEEYLAVHAEIHGNRQLTRFYEDQRSSLNENLRRAEHELQEFSLREGIVDPKSEIETSVRFVAETEANLRTLSADISGAEEKIRSIQRQVAEQPPVIKRFQYVEVNPVITLLTQQLVERQIDRVALEQKYTDKDRHLRDNAEEIARLETQLDEEQRTRPTVAGRQIVRANPVREARLQDLLKLESNLSEYRARRAALEEQHNAATRHLVRLRGKSLEYDRLLYEVSSWRETQELYRRREEEARVSEAMDKERMVNVEVVQKPGLTLPRAETQQRSALLALLSGLIVSLGGAFGVEYFNRSVRSERDVERQLGLPMLAAISDSEH